MNRCFGLLSFFAASAVLLPAQHFSFAEKVYPIFEKAGCRNCHTVEGVASATRLHFPAEDATTAGAESFGKSLVENIDRQNPGNSMPFFKPTKRYPHARR